MEAEAQASVRNSPSLSKYNTPVHASADTSVHSSVDTSKRKVVINYGQIPCDVMLRSDIPTDAKLVFACINMQSPGHESVAVSLREMGKSLPFKKSKIGNLVRKLIAVGLIVPWQGMRGQVKVYRINHPNWKSEPMVRPKCPRCHEEQATGSSGVCSKCVDSLRKRVATA